MLRVPRDVAAEMWKEFEGESAKSASPLAACQRTRIGASDDDHAAARRAEAISTAIVPCATRTRKRESSFHCVVIGSLI